MPMVILAAIIVGGLVTALFASALTSQRTTRFDREFTRAFHGADAGMQTALSQIRSLDPQGSYSGGPLEAPAGAMNGNVAYDYTATKVGREWHIRASGTIGDTTRHLEATVIRPSRFFLAAFAKTLVGLRGGNGASSYDGVDVNTGMGALGTNGDIELIGDGFADELFLFGPTAECTQTQQNCEAMESFTNRAPEPHNPETQFIDDALNSEWCEDSIAPYVASVHGPLVGGGGPGPNGEYCFSSVRFDADTVPDASGGPAEIYVSGDVTSANQVRINCQGCIDRNFGSSTSRADVEAMLAADAPVAGDLQIYSAGHRVSFGNHTYIAAAVYAPNASCHGNPSNAQGTIFGSMICNDISNQGGWTFWFDERLQDIGASEWRISGIREEGAGTSSF
jgi:hypothetical protein